MSVTVIQVQNSTTHVTSQNCKTNCEITGMFIHCCQFAYRTDGMVVPLGKAVDTGTTNPDGYTLNYNEFIVYDPAQVRMRYLLKVQFNF